MMLLVLLILCNLMISLSLYVYPSLPRLPSLPLPPPVYLLLGLIVMLVVLETFCELQQLKQLRQMFYLKKEKPQDRLAILEHDHLSFTSVSQGSAPRRSHKLDFSAPVLTSPCDDPMIG